MRIIFFGLGSIGKRHAKLLKKYFDHELFAFRSKKESVKNKLGIKEIYDLKEIDSIKPDIAFITNPTNKHIETAIFCAKKSIHLFIEKPLSNNEQDLRKFLNVIKKNNIFTYTAYNFRFHPVIQWIKEHLKKNKPIHVSINTSSYLPDWRKNFDHLKNYSAIKEMGGGVVLDLSHEIDYLYHFFGNVKNIKSNFKKLSNVTNNSEDFADILLEFNNNIYANIHLNCLSRLKRREVIIDFKDYTIVGDLILNKIEILKENNQKTIKFNIKKDDVYLAQLNYFFTNFKKKKIMNDINESLKVFNIIMKIKE